MYCCRYYIIVSLLESRLSLLNGHSDLELLAQVGETLLIMVSSDSKLR